MTPPESSLGAEIERLESTIKRLKAKSSKDRKIIAELREELKRERAALNQLASGYGLGWLIEQAREEIEA